MNGHQLHRPGPFRLVHIGKQGRMVQIIAQSHFFPGLAFKIVDGLLQFCQIIKPVLFSGGPEHGFIAAFVQDRRQQVRQFHLVVDGLVLFDHTDIVHSFGLADQIRFQQRKKGFI